MKYPTLPNRAFRSPLIEYANFEDGSYVNLIRLIKPYANGNLYAIHGTSSNSFCINGLFKTYEAASHKFDLMVNYGSLYSNITERGKTGN